MLDRHAPALVLHLIRDMHEHRRLEMLTRGFLSQLSSLTGDRIEELLVEPAAPHYQLTAQERTVLKALVHGQSTNVIAGELHVSSTTIRNHVEHILQKLSAHSRVEAVARAIREKLV